jgi:hypothetical protein
LKNPEDDILEFIIKFFCDIFEVKTNYRGYKFARYTDSWLSEIGLSHGSKDEAKTARTTKRLQELLISSFGERIKAEAPVAENMTLRFDLPDNSMIKEIDSSKLQAFDILDMETGCAFEISLADAYAEFFKDVLKALLDARVKKLYLCMRNHNYKGAGKSGYIRVVSSQMIQQYILLSKLYKLDVHLVDLFPECNAS